jgi:hypothetical protein
MNQHALQIQVLTTSIFDQKQQKNGGASNLAWMSLTLVFIPGLDQL